MEIKGVENVVRFLQEEVAEIWFEGKYRRRFRKRFGENDWYLAFEDGHGTALESFSSKNLVIYQFGDELLMKTPGAWYRLITKDQLAKQIIAGEVQAS